MLTIITVHPRSLVVSAGEIGGRKIISGLQRLNVFGSGLPAWERIIIKQQLGLHHFFSFSFRERGRAVHCRKGNLNVMVNQESSTIITIIIFTITIFISVLM